MEINATQFREHCFELIDEVHTSCIELIITKHGKPWAKLVSTNDESSKPFIGSFTGVGKTVGDLLEPFDDEWELD
jgi:prevent-host-death family protein